MNNTGIGIGLNAALQVDASIRTGLVLAGQKQEVIDALRAEQMIRQATQKSVPVSSSSDFDVAVLGGLLQKAREELAKKDALILEWMHSNDAFRSLARKYGKKIGVTDEQRQIDFAEEVVNLAEEEPRYANTTMAEKRRRQLAGK